MIAGYGNGEVSAALNSTYFTPYQMKGLPLIETTNPPGKSSQGSIDGGHLAWTFDQPFDDNEYYTLTYYVMLSPTAQGGLSYPPILSTSIQYGYQGSSYAIHFPSMYIGAKGPTEESPSPDKKEAAQGQGPLPVAYGAPLEYWISPFIQIKGIDGKQAGPSSAKVSVKVDGHQRYRYQWQI